MLRKIVFLSLLLLSYSSWSQQLKQSMRGTVTDEASQAPIPFATVTVINSNPLLGAQADAYGNYQMDSVPIGRVSLEYSAIGYESRVFMVMSTIFKRTNHSYQRKYYLFQT